MLKQNSGRLMLVLVASLCSATQAFSQKGTRSPTPTPTPESREARRTSTLQIEVSAGDSGDKIDGATVHVESKENGERFRSDSTMSSQGVYTFSQVPQGRVLIQVVSKPYDSFGDNFVLTQDNQIIRVTLKRRGSP
jgi:hypothetical protein